MSSKKIKQDFQSIYKLRLVDPYNETYSSSIKTIIADQKFDYDKAGVLSQEDQKIQQNLASYFKSSFIFLKQLYNFAKEQKINYNIDFDLNAGTKTSFQEYLSKNNIQLEISSIDFELIGTKVKEAIDSIKNNKYITDLENKIKENLFRKNNDLDHKTKLSKELIKELKDYKPSVDEVSNIEEYFVFKNLNFTPFETANNIVNLLKSWKIIRNEENYQEIAEIINNLNEFLNQSQIEIKNLIVDSKKYLIELDNNSDIKDPLKTFINGFIFKFSDLKEEIKLKYFDETNLVINKLFQNLGAKIYDHILNENELDQEKKTVLKDQIKTFIYIIQTELNFKTDSFDKLFDDIKLIYIELLKFEKNNPFFEQDTQVDQSGSKAYLNGVKNKLSSPDRKSLFLHIPKNIPSYPTIDRKVVASFKNNNFSSFLKTNKENIEGLKLLDYLCFRAKKIIDENEYFSILKTIDTSYKWTKVFSTFTKNKDILIGDLDLEGFKKSNKGLVIESKSIENSSKKAEKQIKNYKFKTQFGNNKFAPITFIEKTEERDSKENCFYNLEGFLTKKINDLKNDVEIKLLLELVNNDIIDDSFVESWINEFKVINDNIEKNKTTSYKNIDFNNLKSLINTNSRLEIMKQFYNEKSINLSLFYNVYLETLEEYEHKLLLDETYLDYIATNKPLFKKYQKLGEICVESMLLSDNEKRNQKANIAKLNIEKKVAISLKINRMTKRTNGNSTLVFELDNDFMCDLNKSYLISNPIKLDLSKEKVVIKDGFESAQKFIEGKAGDFRVFAGFLNGSTDNKNTIKINLVKDKDGNQLYRDLKKGETEPEPKSYKTYTDWKIIEESKNGIIEVQDIYRGDKESVGATSPAGYPKLYYFFVPIECQSLIIPVKTHTYYLKKYTPNSEIQNYIKIEKTGDIQKLLEFRTKLRFIGTLSSIEFIINKKRHSHNYKFVDKYFVEGRLQFSNPVKVKYDDEGKVRVKYDFEEYKSKFKNILSVDLGEKQLAMISLIPINQDIDNQQIKSASLPIPNELFNKFINEADLSKEEKTKIRDNGFYHKFDDIKSNYKKLQKTSGVVPQNFRNKKNYLTSATVEEIVIQITKLAIKFDAYVVFEKIDPKSARSKKLEVSTLTEIQRKTFLKLGEVGLVLYNKDTFKDTDFEKIGSGVYKNNNGEISYDLKGLSRINPFGTSASCAVCKFEPYFFNKENIKEHLNNKRIHINNEWSGEGYIELEFNNQVFVKIKDSNGKIEVESLGKNNKDALEKNLKSNIYKIKNGNSELINLEQDINSKLFKDGQRININDKNIKSVLGKLIKTRTTQDRFCCTRCGHEDNADRNASINIGNVFLTQFKK